MPYTYNKLKGKIVEVFGNQNNFASKLGVSEVSVSRKLNRKTEFSQSDIERWSNLLGIETADYGDYFFA
nr:MAG TPA: Protein of unknown function (DUF739) [Bacteriophage sp.]